MLEHDDVGSASTLPPPPLPLLLLPSFPPPPPQPAAAIASTANSAITPTALKLRVTLPPPSPRLRHRCSINRGSIRPGAVGRKWDARLRRLVPWVASRSGGTGRRAGLKIRFPSGSVGSIPTFGTRLSRMRRCVRGSSPAEATAPA